MADCLSAFGLTSTRSILLAESGLNALDLQGSRALADVLGVPPPPPALLPPPTARPHPSFSVIPPLLARPGGAVQARIIPPQVPAAPVSAASAWPCALLQVVSTLRARSPVSARGASAASGSDGETTPTWSPPNAGSTVFANAAVPAAVPASAPAPHMGASARGLRESPPSAQRAGALASRNSRAFGGDPDGISATASIGDSSGSSDSVGPDAAPRASSSGVGGGGSGAGLSGTVGGAGIGGVGYGGGVRSGGIFTSSITRQLGINGMDLSALVKDLEKQEAPGGTIPKAAAASPVAGIRIGGGTGGGGGGSEAWAATPAPTTVSAATFSGGFLMSSAAETAVGDGDDFVGDLGRGDFEDEFEGEEVPNDLRTSGLGKTLRAGMIGAALGSSLSAAASSLAREAAVDDGVKGAVRRPALTAAATRQASITALLRKGAVSAERVEASGASSDASSSSPSANAAGAPPLSPSGSDAYSASFEDGSPSAAAAKPSPGFSIVDEADIVDDDIDVSGSRDFSGDDLGAF